MKKCYNIYCPNYIITSMNHCIGWDDIDCCDKSNIKELSDNKILDIVDKIIFDTDLKINEICRNYYIQGMKRYREEVKK